MRDSNPRPTACKAAALPTELIARARRSYATRVQALDRADRVSETPSQKSGYHARAFCR